MRLRKITIVIVLAINLFLCSATGQTNRPLVAKDRRKALPRFESFPVSTSGAPRTTAAFIDDRQPPETIAAFHERIRAAAIAGPDFAGEYVIVNWHCGSACIDMVVVDVKSRRILTVPLTSVSLPMPGREELPLSYRLDSALLIVDGFLDSPPNKPTYGKRYYLWDHRQLKLIHSEIDGAFTERIRKMQAENQNRRQQ